MQACQPRCRGLRSRAWSHEPLFGSMLGLSPDLVQSCLCTCLTFCCLWFRGIHRGSASTAQVQMYGLHAALHLAPLLLDSQVKLHLDRIVLSLSALPAADSLPWGTARQLRVPAQAPAAARQLLGHHTPSHPPSQPAGLPAACLFGRPRITQTQQSRGQAPMSGASQPWCMPALNYFCMLL